MTVMVAEVSVLKEADTLPSFGVVLSVAWPVTLIGMRKWPVKAARAAGEVNTVVWGVELLVTGAKVWLLVPPSKAEALKDSVTGGMATGMLLVGTLIDSFPLVVPVIVRPEFARFSAENWVLNDPDVTTSTSVKVPIVAPK
jgi:hypothetical protein